MSSFKFYRGYKKNNKYNNKQQENTLAAVKQYFGI